MQASRWLGRTVGELALPPAFSAAKIDAAAERLALMLSEEQQWVRDSRHAAGPSEHPNLYRFYIDSTTTPVPRLADEVEQLVATFQPVAA